MSHIDVYSLIVNVTCRSDICYSRGDTDSTIGAFINDVSLIDVLSGGDTDSTVGVFISDVSPRNVLR